MSQIAVDTNLCKGDGACVAIADPRLDREITVAMPTFQDLCRLPDHRDGLGGPRRLDSSSQGVVFLPSSNERRKRTDAATL